MEVPLHRGKHGLEGISSAGLRHPRKFFQIRGRARSISAAGQLSLNLLRLQTGVLCKGRVGGDNAVVHRQALVIVDQLMQGHALGHTFK